MGGVSLANGLATAPASTSTVRQVVQLPSKLARTYDDYVAKNMGQVSQIESALRSLTYIIPGRFRDAEIASEAVHSTVQVLSLYHDSVLLKAHDRLSAADKKQNPSPHARYTRYWTQRSALYRRVATLLQTVRYTELLCEMAAKRRGGERVRWNVVVLLEFVKAVCRLLLMYITRVRSIMTPVLPERVPIPEDKVIEDDNGEALRELMSEDDSSSLAFGESSTQTKRPHEMEWQMPETGMSMPPLPKPENVHGYLLSRVLTADDIRPATKLLNQLRGSGQLAEILHILAPLVYVITLARSKNKRSWTPWLVGLSLELAARQLREKTNIGTTALERDEWARRGWAMGWWAMRGAFYDNVVKGMVVGVRKRMPGVLAGIVEDYEYLWQNYYFSTAN